ncbi:site-specific integrase [Enterococcus ureilyticus]|uniref:tyrosine-type recombinase/integrase n=1 Tax=Enterococcus ureilyticus TaxID=1131292 RepID=UPI001A9329D1|nr:site-specific integrase [Enterococcus ureilyticus]MBO0446586.1 site-specific integrase [Enterococcus ureilyticus]
MASMSKAVLKNGLWRAKISYRDPKKRNLERKDQRSHIWIEKRTKEELEKEKSKYEAIEKNVIILGTFGDLLDKWYKERLNHNKPKTLNEYRKYLNYFIEDEQLENVYVSEIKHTDINSYLNDYAYEVRRDGKDSREFPVSWSTKNQYFSALGSFFSWCKQNEYIQENPIKKLEKPKRHFVAKELPPQETWEPMWGKIFEALDEENKEELTVLVHLALEMGSRQGELTALEWRHVNFEKNEIIINQNLYENKELGTTKKSKGHIVSISNSMADELKRFKNNQSKLIENRVDKSHNYILKADNQGKPYRNSSIYKKWRRFLGRHSIEYPEGYGNFKFHDIRHYSASFLFQNIDESEGLTMATERISKRLGHSSADFTRRYYIYYVPKDDKASANVFENFRKNIAKSKDSE